MTEKKVIKDKNVLFALQEPTLHYVKVAPEQEEYLKVWVKEPTWLEAEKAMNSVMKIDTRIQRPSKYKLHQHRLFVCWF